MIQISKLKKLVGSMLFISAFTLNAQNYNSQNLSDLKDFFNQNSAVEGKTNAQILGIENKLDDPKSWPGYAENGNQGVFIWKLDRNNDEFQIERILLSKLPDGKRTKLSGTLSYNLKKGKIAAIDISRTKIVKLQITNTLYSLWTVYAQHCPLLETIDLSMMINTFSNLMIVDCVNLKSIKLNPEKAFGSRKSRCEIVNNPKLVDMDRFIINMDNSEESSFVISKSPLPLSKLPYDINESGCLVIENLLPFILPAYYVENLKCHQVSSEDVIDLSSELTIDGVENEIVWKNEKNKEVKPEIVSPGVYKLVGKKITKDGSYYVEIKNNGMSPVKKVRSAAFSLK